jgi:hypothetical protein
MGTIASKDRATIFNTIILGSGHRPLLIFLLWFVFAIRKGVQIVWRAARTEMTGPFVFQHKEPTLRGERRVRVLIK